MIGRDIQIGQMWHYGDDHHIYISITREQGCIMDRSRVEGFPESVGVCAEAGYKNRIRWYRLDSDRFHLVLPEGLTERERSDVRDTVDSLNKKGVWVQPLCPHRNGSADG